MSTKCLAEKAQIKKTAAYHKVKNGFNINFLQHILGQEITKLVELQNYTVRILDEMIENLRKRPLNGGLE